MKLHPRTPPKIAKAVRASIVKYKRVFDAGKEGLPLKVKCPKMKIKLKPDARPRRCPEPDWGANGPYR